VIEYVFHACWLIGCWLMVIGVVIVVVVVIVIRLSGCQSCLVDG
jgi:hypothetical protein